MGKFPLLVVLAVFLLFIEWSDGTDESGVV